MASEVSKSKLFGKYASRLAKAHEAHKGDETEYSKMGELPGGIKGGVAQLKTCGFGVYKSGDNEGEPFFRASAIVVKPKDHKDMRVAGLFTSIMEPICDTKNGKGEATTAEEHWKALLNTLRILGVETAELDFNDIIQECKNLEEEQPHIQFQTRQSKATPDYPEPRVWHDWLRVIEYEADEESSEAVDETGGEEVEEVAEEPAKPVKAPVRASSNHSTNGATKPTRVANKATTVVAPAKEAKASMHKTFDEYGDIDSLVEKAEAGDKKARSTLTQMAVKAGHKESVISKADSWQDVADMATAPVKPLTAKGKPAPKPEPEEEAEQEDTDDSTEEGEAEGETEEEEEGYTPSPEDVVFYRPLDKVTRKRAKTPIECEVIQIDTNNNTCTLKSLDDESVRFKGVKWDDLMVTAKG